MNEIYLLGNVGKDNARLNKTASGMAVANFTMATKERKKNKTNEYESTWHKVTLWGATAERYAPLLTTGKEVFIKGSLRANEWTDKDNKKQREMVVNANWVRVIEKEERQQDEPNGNTAPPSRPMSEDDLPF